MPWGMPCPPQFSTQLVTNTRNTASPCWRRRLEPANGCQVSATSFYEYEDTKPRKIAAWFTLDETWLLFAFAGISTP